MGRKSAAALCSAPSGDFLAHVPFPWLTSRHGLSSSALGLRNPPCVAGTHRSPRISLESAISLLSSRAPSSPHPLDSTAMLAMEARLAMSRKILLVTGDGGDSYETLYAYHRFLEARWEPIIAAPARRRLHMLIQDVEPGWDTYTERAGHSVDAHVAIRGEERRVR